MKNKKESDFIECECGAKIKGRSQAHAASLMHPHLNSRIHRERMDAINKRSQRKLK